MNNNSNCIMVEVLKNQPPNYYGKARICGTIQYVPIENLNTNKPVEEVIF